MTASGRSPLLLALDIGTSSARALLFDGQARAVPGLEARETYAMRTTPDGGVETEAEELLGHVESAIDRVLALAGPEASRIQAVACCTFWHSVLGLDPAGAPLTPLLTWADMRSERFGAALRQTIDERAYHARTGAFFHPLYLPTKFLWLREHPRYREVASWLSFGEFLFLRLFGRKACTISMASGTGLLDLHRGVYDEEILNAASVRPDQLSPLCDTQERFVGLREPYARRWPALRDVAWFPAVGDGACNNLGSGCSTPDRIGVMIGTSGAMRVAWRAEGVKIPWGLWCYRADRRRVVMGGALNDGGNLVEWCRKTLNLGSPEAVERELAQMEPDAQGLTFLPFLAGERSPGWAANARASILGLRLSTRPVEILRAGMEAVALRFSLILGILRSAVPGTREIIASGGALHASPTWIQILADALGTPVAASAEPEASSRGAALLVLETLGILPRLEDLPAAMGATYEPDPERHGRYQKALERQEQFYRLLVRP
jgi:gluconokinase